MPNNQQYIAEIIKVAIEGGYRWEVRGTVTRSEMFLDPNFFRAIGKVKKWGATTYDYERGLETDWKWHWHNFIDKIAEKDLDHAIEWLYKLIKE